MSVQSNAELVRRYFVDVVSHASGLEQAQALALLDELLTDDFEMAYNDEPHAGAMRGPQEHKEFLVNHVDAYPNDEWTIEALVAEGDRVCCQWRFEATHRPTGNRVHARAADFFVVRDGRLAQLRRFLDFESLSLQTQ